MLKMRNVHNAIYEHSSITEEEHLRVLTETVLEAQMKTAAVAQEVAAATAPVTDLTKSRNKKGVCECFPSM